MEILGEAKIILGLIFVVTFGVYLWYTFSIVYHLIRFGVGREPKILTFVYFIGSFTLLVLVVFMYSRVVWPEIPRIFF